MSASPAITMDRVSAEFPVDEFLNQYFFLEVPVIFEGMGAAMLHDEALPETDWIRNQLVESGQAVVNTMWFEGNASMSNSFLATPAAVTEALAHAHVRENSCRLWINGRGNLTPSHYDGNLIFVFNLQLRGKKRWRMVSPQTPLPHYPFARAAVFDQGGKARPRANGVNFAEFDLNEGDMVFVPPLWDHSVEAVAEENVNINWVGTRHSGHVNSPLLKREKEMLRIAYLWKKMTGREKVFDLLLGGGIKNYLSNYGSKGWPFIGEITKDARLGSLFRRTMVEISRVPFAIRDMKGLKQTLKRKPLDSVDASRKKSRKSAASQVS